VLEATEISIRVASAPTDIYTAAAKCATSAIATRATVWAARLLITITPTVTITTSRTATVIIRVIAALTRCGPALTTECWVIFLIDIVLTGWAFLVMLNVVVLVNTSSTEDMATLSLSWEHALADCGLTQLALEANLVLSKVVPRPPWKGIHSRLWLFGKGPCSEVSRRVNPSNRFSSQCGEFFGRGSGQWLSPVGREVSFGHLGRSWIVLEELGKAWNAFTRGEPDSCLRRTTTPFTLRGIHFNFF
jgi:hypothetical protein